MLNNTCRSLFRSCLTLTLLLLCSLVAATSHAEEWQQLFNGKDLDGWTVKIRGYELGDNYANTFRVEDGLLKVSYDGYDQFDEKFGHLFYKTNTLTTGCGPSIALSASKRQGGRVGHFAIAG